MIRSIAGAVLLLAAAAHAQVGDMVPEAKTMPAPDWVKPGIRLTWHMMTAAREGASVRPSPFGGHDAKDDKGNKFKTSKGGSVAGQGYTEIIVLAVEPKRIIFEVRSYHLPGAVQRGPATLTSVSGGICTTPGIAADYFVHPAALRNLLAKPADSHAFGVGTHKEKVNGEVRDAVALSVRGSKGLSRWVYDLQSGIMLSASFSSTGRKGVGGRGVDGTDYSGKTWGANHTSYRESAQLDHPWLASPNPEWLGTVKAIDFEGGFKMMVAAGVAPEPRSQRFEPVEVGRDWAFMRRSMISAPRKWLDGGTFDGMPVGPAKGPYVCGSASPSGVWIAPAALQKLTKGQVVYSNPVTEFRAMVFYVGPDKGRDVCVIRWENRLETTDYIHDRKSGSLLRVWTHNRVANTQHWYDLAGSR